MKPAKLRYIRAETAEHAVELLWDTEPTARVLAGGQSLTPALSARTIAASSLIDIMRCPRLDEVSPGERRVVIGAACRQSEIERNPLIRESIPLLSEALAWVAMPQVRSRGTVVGCLAQANPGGEVPVVALALDAELKLLERGSERRDMAAKDVYGVEMGSRLPGQSLILSASFRKRVAGEGWGFSEVQLREGHFALVCCAATLSLDDKGLIATASIAIGGLTANPYRAERAERALVGQTAANDSVLLDAAQMASGERPWPARADLHATGAFRSKVAVSAVVRALKQARALCDQGERSD